MLYLDIGDSNNKNVLVLIHGLAERFDEAWNPQHELSKHYRLIIPSLRGHFGNEKSDITMENYAKDIIELLKKLNITSASFVGLSLGGLITMEIFKQNPDLIEKIILSNTTYRIPQLIGNKIVNASERYLKTSKELLIDKITNKSMHSKKYIDETRKSFYISDQYLSAARATVGCDYTEILTQIDKPTLIIGSYFDVTTPIFNVWTLKYLISHAKVKLLNTGHLSNLECPEEFNKAIGEFIN
jgi:pimeloyl-ACP methyl ester carboxylesterase